MHFLYPPLFFCMVLFFLFSLTKKSSKWELMSFTTFECGFTSYFFSRESFSIHYFLVALIFLFLDLEVCLLLSFFLEFFSALKYMFIVVFLIFILMGSLFFEWKEKKLDWVS